MLGEIFFYAVSIALFIVIFLKMMKENLAIDLISLILQAIGIGIHFIGLIFKIKLNLFFIIVTYLISIILPIIIIIFEYKKIDLTEQLYIHIKC